jgi:type 2 lantibiotic biosynthesis protein LanM
LTHLGKLWNDYTLIQEAARLAIDQLPRLIAQDQQLDIIAGTGGCLASLLALYTVAPSERLLKVAIQCGDHLVATAQRMHCGLGWVAQEVANQPLAGFSHGIAGIAWALLQLAAITKHEGFRNTATEAFCYERSLFCSKEGNWRDLRESGATLAHQESSESFMTAWCHGAPGIGLARLYSLPYIHDADIDREISSALHYTLTQGFGSNHSLCHGDLGNLELVHAVSQVYDDAALAQRVRVIAGTILDDIAHRGWLCGIPSGTETLGLMTGLAGIGYGLLRLAHPNGVPSVLVLAPPTVG